MRPYAGPSGRRPVAPPALLPTEICFSSCSICLPLRLAPFAAGPAPAWPELGVRLQQSPTRRGDSSLFLLSQVRGLPKRHAAAPTSQICLSSGDAAPTWAKGAAPPTPPARPWLARSSSFINSTLKKILKGMSKTNNARVGIYPPKLQSLGSEYLQRPYWLMPTTSFVAIRRREGWVRSGEGTLTPLNSCLWFQALPPNALPHYLGNGK